jgi:threonine synthase
MAAKMEIDRSGVGAEPASAAAVAGVRQLRQAGIIRSSDRVVAVLTGHILKDPGILQQLHQGDGPIAAAANRPIKVAATMEAIEAALAS